MRVPKNYTGKAYYLSIFEHWFIDGKNSFSGMYKGVFDKGVLINLTKNNGQVNPKDEILAVEAADKINN